MRRVIRPFVIAIGLILSATSAGGQAPVTAQPLVLDAAGATTDELVDTLGPGLYQFRVTNLVPKYDYQLRWSVQESRIEPFPVANSNLANAKCPALETAIAAVEKLTEEKDAPGPLATLRAERAAAPACPETDKADALIHRSTLQDSVPADIKGNQFLRVRLYRIENGKVTKTFKWRFVVLGRGQWITSFGLAAVFLPTDEEHKPHYSKGDTSPFTLEPKKQRSDVTAAPYVIYSWVPQPNGIAPTFSGGLGLNEATTPSAFLALGLTVNSNITLSAGGTLTQVLALNGKYTSGETVTANLTEDQINEKVWRVRPFIGLSWRFASNPFKGSSSEAGPAQPKQTKSALTGAKP